MDFISSTIKFLVALLLSFIPIQVILKGVNHRFNIFTPFQRLIKESGKEKLINISIFIISIFLFLLIDNYINIDDVGFGILAGVYFGIIFAIF